MRCCTSPLGVSPLQNALSEHNYYNAEPLPAWRTTSQQSHVSTRQSRTNLLRLDILLFKIATSALDCENHILDPNQGGQQRLSSRRRTHHFLFRLWRCLGIPTLFYGRRRTIHESFLMPSSTPLFPFTKYTNIYPRSLLSTIGRLFLALFHISGWSFRTALATEDVSARIKTVQKRQPYLMSIILLVTKLNAIYACPAA